MRISIVLFDQRGVLMEESIQDIDRFPHQSVDDINPELLSAIVHMIVEGDYVELSLPAIVPSPHNTRYLAIFPVVQIPNNVYTPTHAEIAGVVPCIEVRGRHPKTDTILGRGGS